MSKTQTRVVTVAAAIVLCGLVAALCFVLLFVAALLYGPAWTALETRHGAIGASAAVAAITAGAWWVCFAAKLIFERWDAPAPDLDPPEGPKTA